MKLFAQKPGPSFPKSVYRSSKTTAEPGTMTVAPSYPAPRVSFDFADVLIHAPSEAAVQPKLEVGSAADAHEEEADRVADEIVIPTGSTSTLAGAGPRLSQAQSAREGASTAQIATPVETHALLGPGQALDPRTRSLMESRFGHSFGDVRVHTQAAAAASVRSLNAGAYTIGRDIVFAGGHNARGAQGEWLLAHELAHIVQQRGIQPVIQCGPGPDQPAKSPQAKAETRISRLRTKSAEVQAKLQAFAEAKKWRGEFHAFIAEKFRQLGELNRQYVEAQKEFDKSKEGFYIFEHESTPRIEQKLVEVRDRLSAAVSATSDVRKAEEAYELESRKQELRIVTEQAAIVAEIGKLEKARKEPSQSQYDSLMARLDKASAAADQMSSAEEHAQTQYPHPAPVSRAK
jgi:hypothetical protein